ncbi:c-type cytochrome [bacterium]|nr:MAG: c-type cytochrome [bacterium]
MPPRRKDRRIVQRGFRWLLGVFAVLAVLALAVAHAHAAADPYANGDASAGAKIAQSSGCEGCHGAGFSGGIGPKLVGIEKRLTPDQIGAAIEHPKPPMPDFGFSRAQVADLVAFLSGLDGGTGKPVVKIVPPEPSDEATVLATFSGTPPADVAVQAYMEMGTSGHGSAWVPLKKTDDPRVLAAKVHFSMGGPWIVKVRYSGGQEIDVPVMAQGG